MATQEESESALAIAKPTPPRKIMIGLCPRAQPFQESTESLMQIIQVAQTAGIVCFLVVVRKGVPGWHNWGPLLARFTAEPDCTHLFLGADDVVYPPDILVRFLSLDKDILCPIYRKNNLKTIEIANYEESLEDLNQHMRDGGVYESKFAAAHGMMIKREVIEKMIQDYPELNYTDPHVPGVVHSGLALPFIDEDHLALHDDWAFSTRARKSGFKLWNDYGCHLRHFCSDFMGPWEQAAVHREELK
jgi:hypothetical protein